MELRLESHRIKNVEREGEGEPLCLGSARNKLRTEIMEAHVLRSEQEIREAGGLRTVGEPKREYS